MADTSHLEKMGRELKCPICLSLLDSSVSLTCNHVFCNLCIHKSMKSVSNCPVCKVPYQRREIRPAPHMDSLVNIYKSMKVASKNPVHVTQDESTTKLDAEMSTDEILDLSMEKIDEEAQQMLKHQKTGTSKRSKSKAKAKSSDREQGKSSFSMNKRVQVPQSPSTETPLREAKEEHEKKQMNKRDMNNSVAPPCEHPLSSRKESPGLVPFFWLQDDDPEKPSQQTDEEQLTCTPAIVPSFSDIKDSDDDGPSEMSPRAPLRKCVNVELFDSEMFEWTQRPCSPELCPSPSNMQLEETGGYDGICGNDTEAPSNDAVVDKEVTSEQLDNVIIEDTLLQNVGNKLLDDSCPGGSRRNLNESKISQKRGNKGNKRNPSKRRKVNVDKHGETLDCSNSTNADSERSHKSALGSSKSRGTSKSRSEGSPAILPSDKPNELAVSKLGTSLGSERVIKERNTNKIAKTTSKRIKKKHGSDMIKTSMNKKPSKAEAAAEVIHAGAKRGSDSTLESVGKPTNFTEKSEQKNKRDSEHVRTSIETSVGAENNLQEKRADRSKESFVDAAVLALNINQKSAKNNGQGVHLQTGMPTLRKCNASPTKCGFCLTTEETEASGEMFHYAQGKSVPADHKGDSVIHTHKNCAEWAPNVYFEDDIAVNLEEELARSRRIKCSLCGVKGAALGCYEKRCSRSFHVPCAKKLRECRWDTDHFVILCPLHASSKLPCEMSISRVSQVKNRRCNLNGKLLDQQPQLSVKCASSKWSCGRLSEKIVLCGSALTTDEKEAVSEFSKSSGVVLSAHWNPTVTHVIASTIQSGGCKRTLKVLKGILEGKWILSIKWVRACMEASKLVEETPFEINCDIYGIENGPYQGRLRLLNKQPKLFTGFKFYLTGDFQPSYMTYLQDLVITAGGTILHRKPIIENSSSAKPTLIIYAEQPDKCHTSRKDLTPERRRSDAEALASSSGASVAHDAWVFNCLAGHKVLVL